MGARTDPKRERKTIEITLAKPVGILAQVTGENELRVWPDINKHNETDWLL